MRASRAFVAAELSYVGESVASVGLCASSRRHEGGGGAPTEARF